MIKNKPGFRKLTSEFYHEEDIILRDFLAMERTALANERTLFSYIRSSVYLTLAGIAFTQLKEFAHLNWIGFLLFGLSIILIIYGIVRFSMLNRKLHRFYENLYHQNKKLEKKAVLKTDKTRE